MSDELQSAYGRTAARVAVLTEMPVGPTLVARLVALQSAPINSASAVDVTALWDKVIAWAHAQKMVSTLDAINGTRGLLPLADQHEALMLASQEIACASHLPYATAANAAGLVERVADCLPASWEALDRGEVSLAHLKAVERATRHCVPELAEAVDAQVIPRAVECGWTPSETGKEARKLLLALDPQGAAERAETAKNDADVRYYPGPDETASLVAEGDALLVRWVFDTINTTAEAMGRGGDERPVGVRRLHALADAVLGASGGAKGAVALGEVLALANLTTLMGLDDHPGELVGYGPISADSVRRLAADHRLRRLVTDPLTGAVVDLGRRSYAPSARLRKAVQAVNPTCTAPGCCRPAIRCELDHRDEFDRGGCTDQCNLKPLCKMHHQMKTKKRWRVDQNPDGSETWTSFLGFTYTKKPSQFPLPDPLPADDEPPVDIANRLPQTFDPDPPHGDEPLPEPPPLTDEQYAEMERALDTLDAMDLSFRQWCDKHYDEARLTGLVA